MLGALAAGLLLSTLAAGFDSTGLGFASGRGSAAGLGASDFAALGAALSGLGALGLVSICCNFFAGALATGSAGGVWRLSDLTGGLDSEGVGALAFAVSGLSAAAGAGLAQFEPTPLR